MERRIFILGVIVTADGPGVDIFRSSISKWHETHFQRLSGVYMKSRGKGRYTQMYSQAYRLKHRIGGIGSYVKRSCSGVVERSDYGRWGPGNDRQTLINLDRWPELGNGRDIKFSV